MSCIYKITNIENGKEFISFADAERYYNVKSKMFSNKAYKKGNDFVISGMYHIKVIN